MMDWRLEWHNDNREAHVLPNGEDHHISWLCPCYPRIDFENGSVIVVHMALDGRHLVEQARAILNPPTEDKP